MKKSLRFSFLTFGLFIFFCSYTNYNSLKQEADIENIYDSIMYNIRVVQWNSNISNITSTDAYTLNYSNSMQTDGSWSDINYTSTTQTSWNPLNHLNRLKTMALSASFSSSNYYNDSLLCSKIELGMEYWYDEDPRSSNWYNQQIASPKLVGEILILLRSTSYPVRSTLEDSLLSRMESIGGNPSNSYSAGGSSNKINISCHWIYRGCLSQNSSVLERGVDSALAPIKIDAPSLGIQVDNSYQEHGNQLYIANYGTVFIDNVSNIALYLIGTKYKLSDIKLSILSNYARNIFIQSMRGNYSTFSAPGRQIANKGKLKTSNNEILERMKLLDSNFSPFYDTAIQRLTGRQSPSYGIHPVHNHYWISDYTTHLRPEYSFDVRCVSINTIRTEQVNDENLKGYFLSDGATNVTVDGDEYYNVFPSWDWSRIPGTTTPHYDTLANMGTTRISGSTTFVGGVSDSLYGASVYDMSYSTFDNIKAKKAWFFFDKEIVCLGAGISSTASNDINTTVNQCLAKDGITYFDNSEQTFTAGQSQEYNGTIKWVLHDKIGYVFPDSERIGVSSKTQTGNWYNIAQSQTDATVSNDVFTLWINHGIQPSGAKYSYIVVPNISSSSQMENYVNDDDIEIAENNDTIQSVYNKNLNLWEIIFYKGNFKFKKDSFTLWTNQPCVIMFKRDTVNGKITGHIADPTKLISQIKVYASIKNTDTILRYSTVTLPSGSSAGSSISFEINDESQVFIQGNEDSLSINASEDAYVDQANPTYNYGISPTLVIKKNTTTTVNNREAFIKFNLDTLSLKASQINSVKLRLVVNSISDSGTDVYNWIIQAISSDDWAEGTLNGASDTSNDPTKGITWNNITNISASSTGTLASATGNQPAGTVLYFDVTSQFLEELQGDKILSLMLYEDAGGTKTYSSFYSSNCGIDAYVPKLIIDYNNSNTHDYSLPVKEDTYADQANPTYNYGSSSAITIKKNSSTSANNREGYLKFDLSSLHLDPSYIVSVRLRMYVKSVNSGGSANYNWITKYEPDDSWAAGSSSGIANTSTDPSTGITWSNSRTISSEATTILASTLGWQPASTPVYFDVTGQFLNEYAGDKVLSLLLFSDVGDSKGDATFYSADGPSDSVPQLIITTLENVETLTPLTLSSFTATINNSIVALKWKTYTEFNTKYAKILRSIDGDVYDSIGVVPLSNNSSEIREYNFNDINPNVGVNYYKLKLYDMDNSFYESSVVGIRFNNDSRNFVNLFPNPAKSITKILSKQDDELLLLNNNGIIIKYFKVYANEIYQFNTQNLNSGIYYIKSLKNKNVQKLIIIH